MTLLCHPREGEGLKRWQASGNSEIEIPAFAGMTRPARRRRARKNTPPSAGRWYDG